MTEILTHEILTYEILTNEILTYEILTYEIWHWKYVYYFDNAKNQTNIRITINEPLTFTWWHNDQQNNDDLENTIDRKAMNDNGLFNIDDVDHQWAWQ